jgi:very-short-patch-repair endonuclease
MSLFTRDLEDLLDFSSKKYRIVNHLKKNYKENIHFIIEKNNHTNVKKYGGQNKIDYFLTEESFELLKNSYNLRNKYIVNLNNNVKQVKISMCIENQTIGFIENSYNGILNVKRQFVIGKYRIDLYFIDFKLAVECDEFNHEDRDIVKEKLREEYILLQGNKLIRFNPNEKDFDLSNILSEINKILFAKSI